MKIEIWGKPVPLNKLSVEVRQMRAAIRNTGTQSLTRLIKFATLDIEGVSNATTARAEAVSKAIKAYLLDARPETAQDVVNALKMAPELTGFQFDIRMRKFIESSTNGRFILGQFERNFAR